MARADVKKDEPVGWSKVLFAAGMGPLGFGFLRFVLFTAYRENLVWFAFWEEITELLYIFGVGVVLWIFRKALLQKQAERNQPAESI